MKSVPRILDLSTRSVLTAAIAILLASGAVFGVNGTAVVLLLSVLVFAWGWPKLMALPVSMGTTVVVGIAGVGSLAVVYGASVEPWLRSVPLVLAFAIVLAFINELARPDDRSRVTESLVGTVSGAVLVVCAAGWLAADRSVAGNGVVIVTAIAIAVASAVAAIPVYGWSSFGLTALAGLAAAVVTARTVLEVRMLSAVAVGLVAGLLVASAHLLLVRLPTLRHRSAALAAVVVPLAVAGPFVYAVTRLTLET